LFELAVQFSRINDQRRARRESEALAALSDEEASSLTGPEPIRPAESIVEPPEKSAGPMSDYSDTL
jgi:sec-independent protein translocase protein TatC